MKPSKPQRTLQKRGQKVCKSQDREKGEKSSSGQDKAIAI